MKGYILNDDKRLNSTMLYLIKQNCLLYDSFLGKQDLDFILFGYNGLNEYLETNNVKNYCKLTEDYFKNIPASLKIFTVKINPTLKKLQEKYGFYYKALMEDPDFISKNAWLSGEGVVGELLKQRCYQLSNSKIAIIGYGHCGKAIAELLSGFHCDLYIIDTDLKAKEQVLKDGFTLIDKHDLSFILPECVLVTAVQSLDQDTICHLPKETYYFDIASAPYGYDHSLNLKHDFLLKNLPASYGYKSAGILVGKWLERSVKDA